MVNPNLGPPPPGLIGGPPVGPGGPPGLGFVQNPQIPPSQNSSSSTALPPTSSLFPDSSNI